MSNTEQLECSPFTELEALDKQDPELDHEIASPAPAEQSLLDRATSLLIRYGVETNGIDPISPSERTDKRLYQMFFVWFSTNMNVIAFGGAASGPAFYGIGLRDCLIILLIVDFVACIIPAYFAVFGPKLGMRSMVQARYTWGYYGAMLPSALNVFSMQGFLIISCIIGGQLLASVSGGLLNDTLGIVIISLISLVVTFFGYRVIHWYESVAWIPNVILFILMLGVGGKHLAIVPTSPSSASTIITYSTTMASSAISWCTMTSDYGVYHDAKASSLRIFSYTFAGFFFSTFIANALGVAFAASAVSVPLWAAGFDNGNSVGGLVAAVMSPLATFGKIVVVLVSLSVPSMCAPTMYTFSSSLMTISQRFAQIPRYIFVFVSVAILIPVAIEGALRYYNTFTDVINIIGYWSVVHGALILMEHAVFRKCDYAAYVLEDWNNPKRLPLGIAATATFLCAFGIIIPCMNQAWYVGPIAAAGSGDIGIIAGSCAVCILYPVFRRIEKRFARQRE
ncbi:cytosine-purine permease [Wolfiporia cocos MD-104 SS10]|uniref:Cytosine-purine permease n=1 Tax=Wolfiporia cocos (strain MD-104) TaxID=742152 RepID=A0A2H3K0V4_WOLCO|nr:cytosine-purine permease [Wolfiporia cocos MD-104 SS10]